MQAWTWYWQAASGRLSIAGFPRTMTLTGRAPVSQTSGLCWKPTAKSRDGKVVAVYQDDGYTGLNMERPDLKRMLKAIERRQINLVVTKDLSRLGRNYLQTGFLIEDFFPRNGVRYIAMNDGIDTMRTTTT